MEAFKSIMSRYEAMQNQILTTALHTIQGVLIGVSRDLAVQRNAFIADLGKTLKELELEEAAKPTEVAKEPSS